MNTFEKIFDQILIDPNSHSRSHPKYKELDTELKELIANSDFINNKISKVEFGPFGEIIFPFINMGAISSIDLFGLDEVIIFAYYWKNRNKYKKCADIGANIGLHSLIMSKCNWTISAYEPDPFHTNTFKKIIEYNEINNVEVCEAAVSDKENIQTFIRVLGNTTGSHLMGAKSNPYGELEKIQVNTKSIKTIININDFIKMDVEGEEANIIQATNNNDWLNTDMLLEVGTESNAKTIYDHISELGINLFSQKAGWSKVNKFSDMPTSYKEGSLFISSSKLMNW